jgi:hypothetical protein
MTAVFVPTVIARITDSSGGFVPPKAQEKLHRTKGRVWLASKAP